MDSKTMLEKLNWRYATKKYDPTKKLSDAQIGDLLEAMRLAPSSFGLTPFRVYHVTDMEKRKSLQAAAFGQTPFVEASEILVFAVPINLDQSWVDAYFNEIMKVRGMSEEMLKGYKDMVSGTVANRSADENQAWAARQAYIALGFLLSAAAVLEIDATPMEGFSPAMVDTALKLSDDGMTAVVTCALGYRAADDASMNYKKVRFPISEMVKEV